MQNHTPARVSALFSIAAALGACGGGSDAPVDSTGNAPPPVESPAPPPPAAGGFTLTLSTDKSLVIQGSTASVTATVTRNELWEGEAATEPYEASWATEAIFFVRSLEAAMHPPEDA